VKDPVLGNVVQAETPEGWLPYFSFTEDPHFPHDFVYVHAYCVQQPDSVFRNKLFVHRINNETQWHILVPTPEMPDYVLRIKNETEVLKPLRTKDEMLSVLKEVFDLDYSAEDLPETLK
jgi:arylamine N-acetyltransferase